MGLLRMLLALAVLLSHAGGIFKYSITGGIAAVQIFFIISGFFMATVLSQKYDPVTDKITFYKARALRIFIPYYVVLTFTIILAILIWFLWGHGLISAWRDHRNIISTWVMVAIAITQFTIVGQDFFLFIPPRSAISNQPLELTTLMPLPPMWSVSLELMFYFIAPFLIRLKTQWLWVVFAFSTLLRIFGWMMGIGVHDSPWFYRFFPFELALFVMGMIAFRISQKWKPDRKQMISIAVGFLVCVFLIQPVTVLLRNFGVPRQTVIWPTYFFAMFAVPVLFELTKKNKLDMFLANLSYPIYLIHWPIIGLVTELAPTISPTLRSIFSALITFVLSWLLTEYVEKPVDRYRQKLFKAKTDSRRTSEIKISATA